MDPYILISTDKQYDEMTEDERRRLRQSLFDYYLLKKIEEEEDLNG